MPRILIAITAVPRRLAVMGGGVFPEREDSLLAGITANFTLPLWVYIATIRLRL